MASYERHWWDQTDGGLTRKDRRPCEYLTYRPDEVAGRPITLTGEVAAEVTDAERAIARFDESVTGLAETETLARLLLRAESVASSKIEGLEVGGARLLRADAINNPEHPDVTAVEVLRNIEAMQWAIGDASAEQTISIETIRGIHERLLRGTRLDAEAGRFRQVQNWIGGSDYNPCSANFVSPPPELIVNLLDDLVGFLNEDSLPAVVQAAIAHAQFETLHPFVDGNGRTGRALIHVILRKRGLSHRALPPISLILATHSDTYVRLLNATRYEGLADGDEATASLNDWIGFFAGACQRAVSDAAAFERELADLTAEWEARVGPVRADSAVKSLLQIIPATPILTVAATAEKIDRSFRATNDAIRRLVELDILRQTSLGRRNRAFMAPEVIERFTALERRLASPTGDTFTAKPARPVPHRH